jgi:hypothetical protein
MLWLGSITRTGFLGASMGGLHGCKIYEREKDFSCSWRTHGLDKDGLGVV